MLEYRFLEEKELKNRPVLSEFKKFLRSTGTDANINATDETVWFLNNNGKKFVFPLEDLLSCLQKLSNADQKATELFGGDWGYEERRFRRNLGEILNDLPSNAVVSNLGSQTPNTVRCLELLAYFLLGEKPSPTLDVPKVLRPDRLKLIFSRPSLKNEFKSWLEEHTKLGDNSQTKYVGALSGKLSEIAGEKLFLIDRSKTFQEISDNIVKADEFAQINANGNNMYSASLSHYRDFLLYREGRKSGGNRLLRLPKPFLLLAGISGTGKSRFVKEQAKASSGHDDGNTDPPNYCLVPVRPDWHEPSDLLGYVSRIGGTPKFVATDFLRFCAKAWLDATDEEGNLKQPSEMTPHWLCLDEMNLAPVEQYFADYLSVIETRKWNGNEYTCGPLLRPSMFDKDLDESALTALFHDLFDTEDDPADDSQASKLWNKFKEKGMPVPPNLIVAGTVNMDETTHGFSRKVIDRALTLDFQEFFPNEFDKFLPETQVPHRTLSFPVYSQADADLLAGCAIDPGGEKTKDFAKGLNDVLKGTPFELAYRALNELLLSVACFANIADSAEGGGNTTASVNTTSTSTDSERADGEGITVQAEDNATTQESSASQAIATRLQAIWDDFLMQKVLPRIEGDGAKLKATDPVGEIKGLSAQKYGKDSILHQLYALLKQDALLGKIWEEKKRPDLLRDTTEKVACPSLNG